MPHLFAVTQNRNGNNFKLNDMKLIEVEGHKSEHRFVGGGFGDTGFRTVQMPYRRMYLVNDLKDILHLINPNHVRSVKDISNKEYDSNKELYERYAKYTAMLIEDDKGEKEYEREKYEHRGYAENYLRDNYPEKLKRLKRFYQDKRHGRYDRGRNYLLNRMNEHLKAVGKDTIIGERARTLIIGLTW